MRIQLTGLMAAAKPVVERLASHGFEAVFVGGAVRDTILGLPVKDVDIATAARPEQVLALFSRCIPTGLKHGTITVLHDGAAYEVTTFRQESVYEKHRKPEHVVYISDLDGDLLRRDFTMNAMAITVDGQLHDPYDGLKHLNQSTLRCVGDADARFQEDALRMVRAIRFIGVYGLVPSLSTWRALKRHRALLKHIAMERVLAELDKLIASKRPERALHWLWASGLLHDLKEDIQLVQQLKSRLLAGSAGSAGAARPENGRIASWPSPALWRRLSLLPTVDERWAALLIALQADEETVLQAARQLRLSNDRRNFLVQMIRLHEELHAASQSNDRESLEPFWIQLIIRYGERAASQWLAIAKELSGACEGCEDKLFPSAELLHSLEQAVRAMPLTSIKQLAVKGHDLERHLGRKAGPWLGELLNRLLLSAAAGQLPNDKETLLRQALLWDKEVHNHE